jgi:hypothetical protein
LTCIHKHESGHEMSKMILSYTSMKVGMKWAKLYCHTQARKWAWNAMKWYDIKTWVYRQQTGDVNIKGHMNWTGVLHESRRANGTSEAVKWTKGQIRQSWRYARGLTEQHGSNGTKWTWETYCCPQRSPPENVTRAMCVIRLQRSRPELSGWRHTTRETRPRETLCWPLLFSVQANKHTSECERERKKGSLTHGWWMNRYKHM